DGNFPDHEPNPLLPENRQFIIDKVKAEGADVGIAWDGDADRCFFIDDQGEFVDGDFLTALLAKLVLVKTPGADILYDVRASGEINSTVDDGDAKMKEIEAAHPDAEISWLDGVSVDYPDWHFNVRPSNTEPLLRLNLESLISREDMEAKRDEMLAFIRS